MPTKCISKPDEKEVKTAIKKVFDLTVPEVLIHREYGRVIFYPGKLLKEGKSRA